MIVMDLAQSRVAVCRQSLQYALGLETILLVALFALYARYNRRARDMEMDADEVIQLSFPFPASHSSVSAQHAKHCRPHVHACRSHQGPARARWASSPAADFSAPPHQIQQPMSPSPMHSSAERSGPCARI